jgi:hypothetical protein
MIERLVSAGEPIAKEFNERSAEGAIIEQDVTWPAKTKLNMTLRAGEALFRIQSNKSYKACTVRPSERGWPACLIDDDGDGRFDRGAKNDVTAGQVLTAPIPYRRTMDIRLPAPAGFQRTLVYQGLAAASLKISYREFSDNLARPAFNEELSIPLGSSFPQKVAAKGIVFTVYAIDGLGMTYSIDDASAFK